MPGTLFFKNTDQRGVGFLITSLPVTFITVEPWSEAFLELL